MHRTRICITFFLFWITTSIYSQNSNELLTPEQAANAINSLKNIVSKITPENVRKLPVGISKTVLNTKIDLAISSANLYENYAELTIYARVTTPKRKLFFGGQGIKLSYTGQIFGDATLVLLHDYVVSQDSSKTKLTLKGTYNYEKGKTDDNLTYATIDCNGIKEFGIAADLELSSDIFHGVTEDGHATTDIVKTFIKMKAADLDNFVANIDLPKFGIKGIDDFVFSAQNIVFDFSDKLNMPMDLPVGYSKFMPPIAELWEGIYMKNLTVYLPSQFNSKDKQGSTKLVDRTSFEAKNLILDDNGISGLFSATLPVLSFENGSASGWKFSVDQISMKLECNTLQNIDFNGYVGLPTSKEDKLAYKAFIGADNKYTLTVESLKQIGFDIFNAKAVIDKNSLITLKVDNGKFVPEAMLNGSLIMGSFASNDSTSESSKSSLKINFQKMHLTTTAPYITVESFGYKESKPMLANFPVDIKAFKLVNESNDIRLDMDVYLNLSTIGLSGNTSISVIGEIKHDDNRQIFVYKGLKVGEIAIDAAIAETFRLKGRVALLRNDPVFGNAFTGSLKMNFEKILKGVSVSVGGMFGQVDNNKYWFVDGAVGLGRGFPVMVALNITGFAGGATMGMKKVDGDNRFSALGTKYIPDSEMGLGLKAGIMFSVSDPKVFNAEAMFELQFYKKSHGLSFAGIYGAGQFLGKINGVNDLEDASKGIVKNDSKTPLVSMNDAVDKYKPIKVVLGGSGISAKVAFEYNVSENSFYAQLGTYVNIGNGIIRGINSNNGAGAATIYIDDKKWSASIGTPKEPIGVEIGIGNYLNIKSQSYFMMGYDIPEPPVPPQQVTSTLSSGKATTYMSELTSLSSGKGVAFGSRLSVNTGDIQFAILYARLEAGLGFDVMLKEYPYTSCTNTNEPIGINGWYANGQAYAYLNGEFGVKYKKKHFKVLSMNSAILMQAKLPNPIWLHGSVAVKFRILFGLIKGNINFELTLGNECQVAQAKGEQSLPIDINIISNITPEQNADVFATPQVAFNTPIGESFSAKDDVGNTIQYRFRLGGFTLTDAKNASIVGSLKWNKEMDVLTFVSKDLLPSNQIIKSKVNVYLEEFKSNSWTPALYNGARIEETKDVSFTTSEAPQDIPLDNIEYSYPVINQQNFHTAESSKGYIALKRGQSYLFNSAMKYSMNFIGENGAIKSVDVKYNSSSSKIEYDMPNLDKSRLYNSVLSVKSLEGTTESSVNNGSSYKSNEDGYEVRQNNADNITRTDLGKTLVEYDFRTSNFGTFTDKINSIKIAKSKILNIETGVIALVCTTQKNEDFDLVDIAGTEFCSNKALIEVQSTGNDAYFSTDVYPYIYQNYGANGFKIDWRNVDEYGIPPLKAVTRSSYYLDALSKQDKTITQAYFPYVYNLSLYYKRDWDDLRNKIANATIENFISTSKSNLILNNSLKLMRKGSIYDIEMKYILPDGTQTSTAKFSFTNPIDFR
jgi:hypothetical protein